MTKAIALLSALILGGCATGAAYHDQVDALNRAGQCSAAIRLVEQSESDPGLRAAYFAVTAYDCEKNEAKAIQLWTLSARYGNPVAREILAKVGRPIPAPDLAAQSSGSSSGGGVLSILGAAVDGYNSGRNAAPAQAVQPTVRCETRRSGLGSAMSQTIVTECR